MVNRLADNLFLRLQTYFNPERLGPILAQFLINLKIAVTEDLNRVRSHLISLVQKDEDFMADPAPCVVVSQLNDYNIAIELRAWLKDERRHVQKRFDLREKVFKTLTDNKVEMPFETIQLAPHAVTVLSSQKTDKQGADG